VEEQREWRKARENLKTLVSEAGGIPVGLVVFPMLINLDPASYPFRDVCEEVERFGTGIPVPTLSLLPAFLGRRDRTLWVSDADQHPNATGHAIAAEALEPFVAKLLSKH
jgi:hypothetical protein